MNLGKGKVVGDAGKIIPGIMFKFKAPLQVMFMHIFQELLRYTEHPGDNRQYGTRI